MTKFFLCRHGQTKWNQDQRFRGRKDIPLSDQGKKEAEAVADALEQAGVEHIYASPLARSMQTLEPLAKRLGKEVIPLEGVIDMNFGEWEGVKVEDAEKEYPDLFKLWKETPEKVTFPQGESLEEVQARAMRAISRLAVEFPDAAVGVCSHRVVCKLIMLGLLGVKPDKFWALRQDTACFNIFNYKPPNAIVHTINQTHHLEKLGGTLKQDF
jgi:probable phosphoglycerate mutase